MHTVNDIVYLITCTNAARGKEKNNVHLNTLPIAGMSKIYMTWNGYYAYLK